MTKLVSDSYEQLLKRRRSLRSWLGPILYNLCRSAEDSQHPSSCSHWFYQCFSTVILCMVTASQRGKLIEFKSLTTLMFVSSLIFCNTIMFVSINHRKSLNVLPMEDMCRMLTTKVIIKVMSLNEPHYLSETLIFLEEVSQCGLHFPRYRKEVGRKSFTYFGHALFIYICKFESGHEFVSVKAWAKIRLAPE